ncbi:phosphogluconate dehydratase [Legionella beliardensis]|uniref:Phosphogluconate dehydratase n=1 Tax=Legionella beliardensis TaxID=91822 RepID=A0A378I0N0_9GAMM|nr:phosphogluconate dehydratase [Legionella beliardensis]STX28709.1 phosphogluconate dehydratase [Legionella beliardensis]
MNNVIKQVTERIIKRSTESRSHYLARIEKARLKGPHRGALHCGNLAHGFAACREGDKLVMRALVQPNIAIVSAYNDVLSAHKPYENYPILLKEAVSKVGGIAQFAGGVPAMCDGVTQGQMGMDLSLMSRDVIALSATIALSHNLFDGGLMLGICDKIVPGLLIAALTFGHLPFVFVPAGPMPSGISNKEKARIRQLYAEGKVNKEALLDAEAASYHTSGTCTFFGTANSNQLIVEMMGLHLPGASFVNPEAPLRQHLTDAAAEQVMTLTDLGDNYLPIGHLIEAKSIVNGIIGLLATGGSTNHTMHLVAIARAAGFIINWDDFADLSKVIPLVAKIYPNGSADINQFHRAGGMAYLIRTLLDADLLHDDVHTVVGYGLHRYTEQPVLRDGRLHWVEGPNTPLDDDVLRSANNPFSSHGGLEVLSGNIGRAVIKTSALHENNLVVQAQAEVFTSQEEFITAFKEGRLNKDCIIVIRFQGPKACGMPELHQLTPQLSVLQNKGYRVALVTDGRMSGASGNVPTALHVTPEALDGGAIAKIQTGDLILLDSKQGILQLLISEDELAQRKPAKFDTSSYYVGMGRELFGCLRTQLTGAEQGACSLFVTEDYLQ